MDATSLALLLTALGIGGAFVAAINAFAQRRKVGGDTTAVVTAAARELVDPLRKELANERAERERDRKEHVKEIAVERSNVKALRAELQEAMSEARALRSELSQARTETADARRDADQLRRDIRQLETQRDNL